jgi:superfamily I DNA and/or RNA helicase
MSEKKSKKINTLNYWIDIESSTPPNIKTSHFSNKSDSKWNQTVSFGEKGELLWAEPLSDEIEEPKEWIHKVFLGIYNTKYVIKEFSTKEDIEELRRSHNTCLVSFKVDGHGLPIKNTLVVPDYLKSIALSTIESEKAGKEFELRLQEIYATWGHRIRKDKEHLTHKELNDLLVIVLKELEWDDLTEAYLENHDFHSLAYTESLNTKILKEESTQKFDTDDITSSMIVDDLIEVKRKLKTGQTSAPLERYLSDDFDTTEKINVIDKGDNKNTVLRNGLELDDLPMVCWPFTGNYKLVSSQQFAVNKFFKHIEEESVLSVNGPPGTGKTTLLKDIVANIIYKRAEEIYRYKDNPHAAFTKLGETSLKVNSKSVQEIFKMNKDLCGHEIVVASSNNGAVENITKELPLIDEIDPQWQKDAFYFKEAATVINGKDSWGMISASLGNKNNNYNFFSKFLFSQNIGTEDYTKSIFEYILKPNHHFITEKRVYWADACKDFEEKRVKVKMLKQKALSEYNKMIEVSSGEIKADALKEKNTHVNLNKKYKMLFVKAKKDKALFLKLKEEYKFKHEEHLMALEELDNKSMFKFRASLEAKEQELKKECQKIQLKLRVLSKDMASKKLMLGELKEEIESTKVRFVKKAAELAEFKDFEKNYVLKPNQNIPFDKFWEQSYEKIQKSSPWLTDELNNARAELFLASMALHKAFIIENQKPIVANLNAFKQVLNGSFSENYDFAKAVWQTLFLIVPVVSTTFSSFGNLFSDLMQRSIGWLLIDEAGQSTPQAPIGALWRSQRALFVGDPLQVQPVIQIEDKLSNVLLEKNDTEQYWNSTMLSAQEIADRVNPFGTTIDLGDKKWVGMPLRVHRRCDDPMFSISNKIAYDNLMIFGKKRERATTDIENILGRTRWVETQGDPDNNSHWIPAEGEEVLKMLSKVCSSKNYEYGDKLPELYIITPFKNISFSLKILLQKRRSEWCPEHISQKDLTDWIYKSVGTIHSFQGDETDVVFLVLGGNISRPGAIKWVCEEPNILNVATTRAKKAFYIIGNKVIWNSGVFSLVKEFIK